MFTFGFSSNDAREDENEVLEEEKLEWFPASKVEIPTNDLLNNLTGDDYTESKLFPSITVKLICPSKAVIRLTNENNANIVEAEKQHSDLIPAKYEGGLKIWECSYDLGKYLLDNSIVLKDRLVLDLGCGSGIIGLIALLKGSTVHFQDYNKEVIKSVTIPNIFLNYGNPSSALEKCELYSGDWKFFNDLLNATYGEDKKYDLIVTSETIYNPNNQHKLFNVFKDRLKSNGIGFVAGKTYYFGVGGGMRQFESLVLKDGNFNTEIVWKSEEGLQREILKLTRRNTA